MFRYWATGEPNNSGIEECVEILTGQPSQGNWNDFSCEQKNFSFVNMNIKYLFLSHGSTIEHDYSDAFYHSLWLRNC